MKIYTKLPNEQPEKNKADFLVLQPVRWGMVLFILISATTVFMGFKSLAAPYLENYGWLVSTGVLSLAFILLAFLPDQLNSWFTQYITWMIYDKRREPTDRIMLGVFIVGVIALSIYSFRLSRVNGEAYARDVSGEAKQDDVTAIDSTYLARQDSLNSERTAREDAIKADIREQRAYAVAPINTAIQRLEQQIANLESQRTTSNTQWITQQQDQRQAQITSLKEQRAAVVATYADKQASTLAEAMSSYTQTDSLLKAGYADTRGTTVADNNERRTVHHRLQDVFVSVIRGIAGYAVFGVVLLSIVYRLLLLRNGFDAQPVFTRFDFQPSVLWEVVMTWPNVWGRRIVNWSRRKYNERPQLIERYDLLFLNQPDILQEIREFNAKLEAEKNGVATADADHNGHAVLTAAVNGDNHNGHTATKIVTVDTAIGECDQCGAEYKKTVWNKRFCSDECKQAYHARRHNGVPYDPQYVYKK